MIAVIQDKIQVREDIAEIYSAKIVEIIGRGIGDREMFDTLLKTVMLEYEVQMTRLEGGPINDPS